MVRKSVDELESAKKHDPFETMRLVKAGYSMGDE